MFYSNRQGDGAPRAPANVLRLDQRPALRQTSLPELLPHMRVGRAPGRGAGASRAAVPLVSRRHRRHVGSLRRGLDEDVRARGAPRGRGARVQPGVRAAHARQRRGRATVGRFPSVIGCHILPCESASPVLCGCGLSVVILFVPSFFLRDSCVFSSAQK